MKQNNLLIIGAAAVLAYLAFRKTTPLTSKVTLPPSTQENITSAYGKPFAQQLLDAVNSSMTAGEVFNKLGYTAPKPNLLPASEWRMASQQFGTTNMTAAQAQEKANSKDINGLLKSIAAYQVKIAANPTWYASKTSYPKAIERLKGELNRLGYVI